MTWLADARYAGRTFLKNPGFTLFAMLTLALGLGANVAIFSFVDGLLLKPLAYPEADRIVQIWEKPPRGLRNGVSGAQFPRLARSGLLVLGDGRAHRRLAHAHRARRAASGARRPRLGGVLRRARRAGRARTDVRARTRTEPGRDRVIVLSHRFWVSQLGGDACDCRPFDHAERRRLHRHRRAGAGRRVRSRVCRGPGAAGARSGSRRPQLPLPLGRRAVEAGRAVRARAVRDERHRRSHRRAVSRHQEGLGRDGRSPRRSRRQRSPAPVAPRDDGGGGRRPDDRLRQPGEPAAGAGDAAHPRDGAARGARRRTGSARPAAPHRKRPPLRAGSRRRSGVGLRALPRHSQPAPGVLPPLAGGGQPGLAGRGVPDRAGARDRHPLRPGAGPSGHAARHGGCPEGGRPRVGRERRPAADAPCAGRVGGGAGVRPARRGRAVDSQLQQADEREPGLRFDQRRHHERAAHHGKGRRRRHG